MRFQTWNWCHFPSQNFPGLGHSFKGDCLIDKNRNKMVSVFILQSPLTQCSQDIFELLLTNTLATTTITNNSNNNKNYKKKIHVSGVRNFFPGVRPLALHAALSFYSCGRKDVKQDLECVLWSLVMSYSRMCQLELSTVFLETPLHRSQKDLDLSLAHFRLADFWS